MTHEVPRFERAAWAEPASGLRLIGGALVAQMVVVICTFLMLMYAVNARRPDGLQGLTLILALAAFAAQIAMVVGIFRFAKQPAPAPGGAGAQAAALLGLVGVIIGVYVLYVVFQLTSIGPNSSYEAIRSAMEAAENMPKVEVTALVIGLIAMIALLASIAAVARYLQREDLARRAGTAMALVAISAVIYVAIKLGAEPKTKGSAIGVALLAMGVQIAVFVNVWRSAVGLAEALDVGPTAELPRARRL